MKTTSQGKKAAKAATGAPAKAPKTKASKVKAEPKPKVEPKTPETAHYNFYQRYSGLKLQGASLDNCKCIVWECDAVSFEDAMGQFRASLKGHNSIDDDQVEQLLSAVFDNAVHVERVSGVETMQFPIGR